MYHKEAIQNYPLQTYASALLFSPSESVTRKSFCHEEPTSITVWPEMKDRWDACLQVLEHKECLKATVSPDSSVIASFCGEKIRLWDVNSGECLQVVDIYALSGAWCDFNPTLVFSNDSKRLGLTSTYGIHIFDVIYGSCLRLSTYRKLDVEFNASAFSQDLTFFASSEFSGGGILKIWDATSGTCISSISMKSQDDEARIVSFTFLHESMKIVVGFEHDLVVWNLHDNDCVRTIDLFAISQEPLDVFVLSRDSVLLACGFPRGRVAIIDVNSGEFVREIDTRIDSIMPLSFSYDSKWLVLGNEGVEIWDLTNGSRVQRFDGDISHDHSVVLSCDLTKLFSANFEGVRIWENSGGETMDTSDDLKIVIGVVVFSPDSTLLASSATDSKIKIWDTSSKECLHTMEGDSNYLNMVSFSHDSTRLAFLGHDNTIELWDLASSTCLLSLKGHDQPVTSVAFSHDSKLLASSSLDRTIKLWNTENGDCLSTFEGHEREVTSVTFPTNDSTRIASLSPDWTVRIWNTRSSECVQILNHPRIVDAYCLAFSPDGTKLISVSDERIRLWDLETAECLSDIRISESVSRISFDISGRYLNTNIGPIVIPVSSSADEWVAAPNSLSLDRHHIGLGMDGKWITHNSENILWIPVEYRPYNMDASERSIAIALRSRIMFVTLT